MYRLLVLHWSLAFFVWGTSCRSRGRGFARSSLLTPPGGTCSVNLTVLRLQMVLQIGHRVFEA